MAGSSFLTVPLIISVSSAYTLKLKSVILSAVIFLVSLPFYFKVISKPTLVQLSQIGVNQSIVETCSQISVLCVIYDCTDMATIATHPRQNSSARNPPVLLLNYCLFLQLSCRVYGVLSMLLITLISFDYIDQLNLSLRQN